MRHAAFGHGQEFCNYQCAGRRFSPVLLAFAIASKVLAFKSTMLTTDLFVKQMIASGISGLAGILLNFSNSLTQIHFYNTLKKLVALQAVTQKI